MIWNFHSFTPNHEWGDFEGGAKAVNERTNRLTLFGTSEQFENG